MANSEDYLDGLLDSINQAKKQNENALASEQEERKEQIRRRTQVSAGDDFMESNGLNAYVYDKSSRENLHKYFSESDFLNEFEEELSSMDEDEADAYLKEFEEEMSPEDEAIAEELLEDPAADILDTINDKVKEAKLEAEDNLSGVSDILSEEQGQENFDLDLSIPMEDSMEEELPEEPAEEAIEEPVAELTEEPASELVEEPADISLDMPAEETERTLPDEPASIDVASESNEESVDSKELFESLGDLEEEAIPDVMEIAEGEEIPEIPEISEGEDLPAGDTEPVGEDFLQPEFEVDTLDIEDAAAELKDASVQEVPLMDESGDDVDLMDVLGGGDADLMDIGDLLNADENLEELDESRDAFENAAEGLAAEGTNLESGAAGEEGKKGGIFGKILGIFSGLFGGKKSEGEQEDDGTVQIGDTSPTMEELSEEDENILSDFTDDQTPAEGEEVVDKKALKEAKKKEKEEAKKLKAEEKAAKKAQKAAEKAEKKANKPPKEPDNSPVIPIKKLIPFLVLGISFVILVILGGNTIYHARRISEAKSLYETGSYAAAYSVLERIDDLDEEETELYEKARILAKLELKIRQYNLAMVHERYEEALDALIQGTYTYVRNQDAAAELKISDAFNALGAQIEKSMMDEFGVSESAAMDMYAIHKRPDYTRAVREVLKSVNLEY